MYYVAASMRACEQRSNQGEEVSFCSAYQEADHEFVFQTRQKVHPVTDRTRRILLTYVPTHHVRVYVYIYALLYISAVAFSPGQLYFSLRHHTPLYLQFRHLSLTNCMRIYVCMHAWSVVGHDSRTQTSGKLLEHCI